MAGGLRIVGRAVFVAAAVAGAADAARAGACCAGSTSGVPTRVGECEHVVVGLSLGGETTLGRWDADRQAAPSSLAEDTFVATLGAGARWARWGWATVDAPVRWGRKSAGSDAAWGGGAGDVRLVASVAPEERAPEPGRLGLPRPVLGVGARSPTGRSWEASQAPLLADVTGLPGWGVLGSASFEKNLGLWPWAVGADVDVPVGSPETPMAWTAWASGGRYLGTRWTVTAVARHTWTAIPGEGVGTERTSIGARIVRGERLRWRGWLGAEADVPVGGLGRGAQQLATVSGGVAWVR